AWGCLARACSPRQICPPSHGVSSITATRFPLSAATHAADRPAGPAPTTTISKLESPSLIGSYFHSRLANNLATPTMLPAVDRHAAFHANTHSTKRPPRRSNDRPPKTRVPMNRDRGSDNCSGRYGNWLAIHLHNHFLIHAPPT